MSELLAYLTVFLAAAMPWLEVLLVVPAGILAGLPPVPTALVGAAGNIVTLVPLVLGADRLRAWWRRRSARRLAGPRASIVAQADAATGTGAPSRALDPSGGCAASAEFAASGWLADVDREVEVSGRGGRAQRVFERYGVPGLAAIGPLVTGIHVAAIVGLASGADRRHLMYWLVGGVVGWSFLAAGATVLGIDALVAPKVLPDLFG